MDSILYDWISYLDDDETTRNEFVLDLVIEGNLVTFQTKAGNKISLPLTRVKKIKRERIKEDETWNTK